MITIETFRKSSFFDHFTDDLLVPIKAFSSLKPLPAGKTLLTEGEINLNLYILLEGSVDVFVKNQQVAHVNADGQVFGEMSIVNHTTSHATVVAKQDSLFLVLPVESLEEFKSPLRETILRCFYHSCAEALARKLEATNAIAAAYRGVFEELKQKKK